MIDIALTTEFRLLLAVPGERRGSGHRIGAS
jgi:hypothetical protein